MNFRIGFGFDTHRLESGRPFRLGGVSVASEKGAVGHSDADVLIHAICDALLGAAGMRDIGYHFPDTDEAYRGIDSRILLSRCMDLISGQGYKVGNLDATVVLQAPRINPVIPAIIEELAAVMTISPQQIAVKAKTSEKLGFIGREEGVSAYAIVLIFQQHHQQ